MRSDCHWCTRFLTVTSSTPVGPRSLDGAVAGILVADTTTGASPGVTIRPRVIPVFRSVYGSYPTCSHQRLEGLRTGPIWHIRPPPSALRSVADLHHRIDESVHIIGRRIAGAAGTHQAAIGDTEPLDDSRCVKVAM